ncbi:MAG: hypothetical protein J7L15_04450 [Clostridiales bacterium]|nr:hypothetical protein [Clostridiales bacterium]
MRNIDLDIDKPINIMEDDFEINIKDVTSQRIVKKIHNSTPIKKFTFKLILENTQVNIARFMMEGLGYHPKYFICTGADTLGILMKYNLGNKRYEDLLPVPSRRDVLCLKGIPLFYEKVENYGDVLLLVSDIKIERKYTPVCSFVHKTLNIDNDYNNYTAASGISTEPKTPGSYMEWARAHTGSGSIPSEYVYTISGQALNDNDPNDIEVPF